MERSAQLGVGMSVQASNVLGVGVTHERIATMSPDLPPNPLPAVTTHRCIAGDPGSGRGRITVKAKTTTPPIWNAEKDINGEVIQTGNTREGIAAADLIAVAAEWMREHIAVLPYPGEWVPETHVLGLADGGVVRVCLD